MRKVKDKNKNNKLTGSDNSNKPREYYVDDYLSDIGRDDTIKTPEITVVVNRTGAKNTPEADALNKPASTTHTRKTRADLYKLGEHTQTANEAPADAASAKAPIRSTPAERNQYNTLSEEDDENFLQKTSSLYVPHYTVPETSDDDRVSQNTLSITGTYTLNDASDNSAAYEQTSKHGKRKKKDQKENRFSTVKLLFTKREKPRNYFINLLFTTLKLLTAIIIIFGISGLGAILGLAKAYVESIPELDFNLITDQNQTSLIYDANGKLLSRFYGSENREWVSIDNIPQQLQDAFVAVEDVRFWRHAGVDFKRLIGSFILNMSSDSIQGGSTITQQLIKNTMLSTEQTYKRKIREAYLAIQMEKKYDKKVILEAYLNTIPLGGSNYGVKTAAKDFFGKDLNELTLKECATLAGLTQNPSRYNPRLNYYVRHKPENTENRTKKVLKEMYENGFISYDAYAKALDDTLQVLEKSPNSSDSTLLPVIEYTIYDVTTQLLKLNNLEDTTQNRNKMESLIRTEGYNIYTTIDPEIQIKAVEAVENFKGYPAMRYDSDKYTIIGRNPDGTAIRLIQPQAASVIIDYHNGQIKAMVNGRQTSNNQKEFNRPYQSTMPVGSSIKPISVYGPALDKGKAPGSIYYNEPTPIEGWGTEKGYPSNYGDSGYNGNVTMREGIRRSLNTVAAQTLMYDVGIDYSRDTLISLGVNPEHINADGPGLALGTSGITPLEMAGAFSAIANLGEYIQPISFTKITDKNGNVILDMVSKQEHRQVFKQSSAWMLIDMLYTAVNTSGSVSKAVFPGQSVYGKTGTNSDSRGVFFTGFTGYYVASVWVGSDAYKPLTGSATGSKYASPLWHDIMQPIHKGLENKPATTVAKESLGIKLLKFCKYSGKLATSACPETVTDYGVEADLLNDPCTSHVEVKLCNETHQIATEYCPSFTVKKYKLLPAGGELAYLYNHHRDLFTKYYGTVDNIENLTTCSKHTPAWAQDEQNKLALRPDVRILLTRANERLKKSGLSDDQKTQLTSLTDSLQQAYNDPANLTYADYKNRYDNLAAYLSFLES